MSIPVLSQVFTEARRLAIAGSVVARGDFRLKKLLPPLEQAGQQAPVFAKIAEAANAVIESPEESSAGALLELTSLVNAVLYTQGETGLAGTLEPIETTDLGGVATQTSARVLKPLLEALSSTGSGRLELVKDAFERGLFRDLRLVKPALTALDDPYRKSLRSSPRRCCRCTARRSFRNWRLNTIPRARGGIHAGLHSCIPSTRPAHANS